MSEREVRLRKILSAAIDLPPESRRSYVVEATDDSALREEVLELIAGMEGLDDFLEEPAVGLVVGSSGETLVDRPPEAYTAPHEDTPPAPPPRVGPYRVEERLGGGGMGVVYRGYDERLERPVALKQIRHGYGDDDSRRRFRREARAVARLDHPSIVRVHDWLEKESGDWLVLELVEGRHLRRVLDEDGALPPARVAAIGADIAGALSAAHEAGILHRDLKPENVMVTSQGHVKLLDFGLAKHLGSAAGSIALPGTFIESLTAEGRILGTVSAMSPEQAMGEALDERSDLFALGALLYRLLVGVPPFDGGAPVSTMRAIVFDPHPPIPAELDAPPALVRLIDQLLHKDRTERPANARQVLAELRDIAAAIHAAAVAAKEVPTAQRSERRPVTVLAAGLAPALQAVGAEELLETVPRLDSVVIDAIERWGGRLEGRMGDLWIACFGVPKAREDDARRAVHAGLDLLRESADALEGIAALDGPPLEVGVHSGVAVMTRIAGREELALGPTFEGAAAVQGQSRSHVIVSAETRRRVARFFRLQEAGEGAFRVDGVEDEGDVQVGAGVPLSGRSAELDRLLGALAEARAGRGRAVLLSGEPGIGKTRLLAQLREVSREDPGPPLRWLELHGSSVRRAAPFQPVIEHLRRSLDVSSQASPTRVLAALGSWVSELELPPAEMVPYLAALLGVAGGGAAGGSQADLDPRLRKRRIQETLATLWLESAEQTPLIFVVEDLQWLDPSTLDLLTLMLEQVPTVSMLLILSHRLDYQPPWGAHTHIDEIRLDRLDLESAERLITSVAGGEVPRELVERIAAMADGIPLYALELTRVVLESGHLVEKGGRFELAQPIERLVIPATLEESLTARLDQLGAEARSVAQVASVIGREFSFELLTAVCDLETSSLEAGLTRLVEADLAYRKGFGRRTRYLFRHALIHEAAYTSLLRKERRALHRRVAGTLRSSAEAAPDVLAHHLSESGQWPAAIEAWQAAATAAILASAHREAESHVRRAMAGLRRMKAGRQRELAELTLLTQLGRALAGLRGYSSAEVLEAYERAAELCERLQDEPAAAQVTVQVTWGLWAFYNVRSDIPRALVHARRLLKVAERSGSTSDWMTAHSSMAVTAYFGGDLETAKRHAEASIVHDAGSPERELATASPQDLGVNALCSLSLIAWHLGRGADAVKWSEQALELAHSFKHPYSFVFAASWAARLHQSRREPAATLRLADEVVSTSERHGFFWITQGFFFRGCAQAQAARDAGDPIPGGALELMRRGLDAYRATGAGLSVSYMLAQLAEARLWRGELDEADAALAQARDASADGRESYWRAELDRLAGEIALARGDEAKAEQSFRRAVDIARAAGDLALRLRATLPLARLLFGGERAAEARTALKSALRAIDAALGGQAGETGRDIDDARQLLGESRGSVPAGEVR